MHGGGQNIIDQSCNSIFETIPIRELVERYHLSSSIYKKVNSKKCDTLAEYIKKNPQKAKSILAILSKQKPLLDKCGFKNVDAFHLLNNQIVDLID